MSNLLKHGSNISGGHWPARLCALLLSASLLLAACTSTPTTTGTLLPPTETLPPTLTSTPTPTQPTSTPSRTPIPTNSPPTATITPAGLTPTLPPVWMQNCLPADSLRQTASVIEVIDASKIRVSFEDGVEAIVRYLGIDPPQPGGTALQAAAYNRQLVEGRPVTLLQDVTYQDPDGVLPRYVLVGETFVNAALLEHGFARHAAQTPDVACVALFRRLAQSAFDNFSGLWGLGLEQSLTAATATIVPGENLKSPNYGRLVVPTPTRGSPTPRCDPAYPTVCIPPPPPYLNCGDIPYRNFVVLWPDPHDLDGRDRNGIGCEKPTPTP